MNVTSEVINDLLPIYASGECSSDTKTLVEEYLKDHPSFAHRTGRAPETLLSAAPGGLSAEDELNAFASTRRTLRLRSTVMGLAIFFSIAPFSFLYVHGTFYSLITESPASALVYGTLGVLSWIAYFALKRGSGNL